jgi:methylenetetrahydrofolate reductase (NADPH)
MGTRGDLRYANELVDFIRAEHGDRFRIEVAAYPETHPQARRRAATCATSSARSTPAPMRRSPSTSTTPTPTSASSTMRALGVDIPIVPGIMPISNFTKLRALLGSLRRRDPALDRAAHARLRRRRERIRDFGLRRGAALCERLIAGGAPGLHFYTLNLAKPSLNVLAKLA